MHPAVVELLNELEEEGVLWCTNSGRDRESQLEILLSSRTKGLRHMPVALLARETHAYTDRAKGYVSWEPWNSRAREGLRQFHRALQRLLREDLPGLQRRYQPDTVVIDPESTAFLVADENDAAERLEAELTTYVRRAQGGLVSRNGGWVAALPAHLGKGAILREVCGLLGLDAKRVLAVGDHLNDLSMLDGTVARHVGCPADAFAAVQAVVRRVGGRVAREEGPEGTAEILRHHFANLRS